jgi:23S rRNA-/tRNA-specific pseudouridylate synthase
MYNNKIEKYYYAMVYGDFKLDDVNNEIIVDVPLTIYKKSKNKVNEENNEGKIKNSKTIFKKIKYDKEKNVSLLLCQPITGILKN